MAHFAEVDETNTVIRIAVLHDDVVTDEQAGIDFLADLYPESQTWVQAFKDDSSRYNYPGGGSTWDSENDAFITEQPYPSWTLDDDFRWVPPVEHPGPTPADPPTQEYEGVTYEVWRSFGWDEDTLSWVCVANCAGT